MAKEKKVETEIKEFVRQSGGFVDKIHASAEQGKNTLDLIGSYRGYPFMVEVKAPGKLPTETQEFLVKRAIKGGYVSGTVDNVSEFHELFERRILAEKFDGKY